MNPNFLLKDELLYELGIRGIHSDADTLGLRKLFRSIGARDLPLQFDYFNSRGWKIGIQLLPLRFLSCRVS